MEQAKLAAADVIVLQYPRGGTVGHRCCKSGWRTFLRGFSHGSTGTDCAARSWWCSLTTGAAESYYDAQPGGTLLLAAVKATSAPDGPRGCSAPYVSRESWPDEAARALFTVGAFARAR